MSRNKHVITLLLIISLLLTTLTVTVLNTDALLLLFSLANIWLGSSTVMLVFYLVFFYLVGRATFTVDMERPKGKHLMFAFLVYMCIWLDFFLRSYG